LQRLFCVLSIMRCAFAAHLDVGLAERTIPCRFIELCTFPSLVLGKTAAFDKTELLVFFMFVIYHVHYTITHTQI